MGGGRSRGAAEPPATYGLPVGPPDQRAGAHDVGPPPDGGVLGDLAGHDPKHAGGRRGEADDLPERGLEDFDAVNDGGDGGRRRHAGDGSVGVEDADGGSVGVEDGDGVGGEVDEGHTTSNGTLSRPGTGGVPGQPDTYQDRLVPTLGPVETAKKRQKKDPGVLGRGRREGGGQLPPHIPQSSPCRGSGSNPQ